MFVQMDGADMQHGRNALNGLLHAVAHQPILFEVAASAFGNAAADRAIPRKQYAI